MRHYAIGHWRRRAVYQGLANGLKDSVLFPDCSVSKFEAMIFPEYGTSAEDAAVAVQPPASQQTGISDAPEGWRAGGQQFTNKYCNHNKPADRCVRAAQNRKKN
jgi:hypothetical protein